MQHRHLLTSILASGAMLAACVQPAEIEELKSNQKKILGKLDELAKKGPGAGAPPRPAPNRPDPSKTYAFPVGKSASKGPNDAWVTIVEVSDFQCPFCKRVGPTLKQLEEKYGKDLRIVFKHNPLSFHQRALPAALAAECANEQGKFWELHDAMFENQRSLSDSDLESYAKSAGVDMGKWKACYSSGKYKSQIQQDQRTAVTLGARGTPAFFINGRYLSGAQPYDNFARLVDEELKKAKSSGIDRGKYYEEAIVKKGVKKL